MFKVDTFEKTFNKIDLNKIKFGDFISQRMVNQNELQNQIKLHMHLIPKSKSSTEDVRGVLLDDLIMQYLIDEMVEYIEFILSPFRILHLYFDTTRAKYNLSKLVQHMSLFWDFYYMTSVDGLTNGRYTLNRLALPFNSTYHNRVSRHLITSFLRVGMYSKPFKIKKRSIYSKYITQFQNNVPIYPCKQARQYALNSVLALLEEAEKDIELFKVFIDLTQNYTHLTTACNCTIGKTNTYIRLALSTDDILSMKDDSGFYKMIINPLDALLTEDLIKNQFYKDAADIIRDSVVTINKYSSTMSAFTSDQAPYIVGRIYAGVLQKLFRQNHIDTYKELTKELVNFFNNIVNKIDDKCVSPEYV